MIFTQISQPTFFDGEHVTPVYDRDVIEAKAMTFGLELDEIEYTALHGLLNHIRPTVDADATLRITIMSLNYRRELGQIVPDRYDALHGLLRAIQIPDPKTDLS